MPSLLLSGPAGAGKSQVARDLLTDSPSGVVVDFQSLYASLLLLGRNGDGRYPERNPSQAYILALTEYLRRAAITGAVEQELDVLVTNSDGSPARRNFLLSLLGANATERVLDPGIEVVQARLSVNGQLSEQCGSAIKRWYGRL